MDTHIKKVNEMEQSEFIDDCEIREKVCQMAGIDDIGEFSDGFHTFNSLYRQRCVLFAALVNSYPQISWKSKRHDDGELCFGGGWFIVGFDTPEGGYTYHYEAEHWDLFDCEELPCGKHWDGHTEDDVGRLLTIPASASQRHGHWLPCNSWSSTLQGFECSECGAQFQNIRPDNYCGYCGAKMEADNG